MDTEARDKAIQDICNTVLADTDMTIDAAKNVSEALKQTYAAGYQACRDGAIRIMKAKKEHEYE
jgi:hypothetical protein